MIRSLATLALATLLLLSASPITAQPWRPPPPGEGPWGGDPLPGTYHNRSGGGMCRVHRQPRGYLFINENGSRAVFDYVAPGRLQMIRGEWNPDTMVTVSQDGVGRTVLRFKEPGKPPGYWVMD